MLGLEVKKTIGKIQRETCIEKLEQKEKALSGMFWMKRGWVREVDMSQKIYKKYSLFIYSIILVYAFIFWSMEYFNIEYSYLVPFALLLTILGLFYSVRNPIHKAIKDRKNYLLVKATKP